MTKKKCIIKKILEGNMTQDNFETLVKEGEIKIMGLHKKDKKKYNHLIQ